MPQFQRFYSLSHSLVFPLLLMILREPHAESMSQTMPYRQAKALEPSDLMLITPKGRAEITLLRKAALVCESCGCVYIDLGDDTVWLDQMPIS